MVIFHSYVNVYQRVSRLWEDWIVGFFSRRPDVWTAAKKPRDQYCRITATFLCHSEPSTEPLEEQATKPASPKWHEITVCLNFCVRFFNPTIPSTTQENHQKPVNLNNPQQFVLIVSHLQYHFMATHGPEMRLAINAICLSRLRPQGLRRLQKGTQAFLDQSDSEDFQTIFKRFKHHVVNPYPLVN